MHKDSSIQILLQKGILFADQQRQRNKGDSYVQSLFKPHIRSKGKEENEICTSTFGADWTEE